MQVGSVRYPAQLLKIILPVLYRGEVGAEYVARVVHPKEHWASHWVRCGPMLGAQRLCGLRVVEIFGFRAVSRTRHICPMLLPHFLREADYKNVIAAFRACLSRSKFHAVGSTSSCIAFRQQFRSARVQRFSSSRRWQVGSQEYVSMESHRECQSAFPAALQKFAKICTNLQITSLFAHIITAKLLQSRQLHYKLQFGLQTN